MNEELKNKKKFWWQTGIIYHIYPKSFYDANGDGIGDIQGIIEKLDYLVDLGIDAIWLSPIYKSPMNDGGYDISNYKEIDAMFGSYEVFKELLEQAHTKGLKIIMDLVMNHTSHEHRWFMESRSSKDSPKRGWYIWHPGKYNKVPNNWRTNFIKKAWQLDASTNEYYYHSYFSEQPDLNWRNAELKETFFAQIKFWLDLGIDGFRLDVINMLVKDVELKNNPLHYGIFSDNNVWNRNQPETYDILREFRKLLDGYDDKVSIGEIYVLPPGKPDLATSFLGNGNDMLHLAFDFSLLFCGWNSRKYYKIISSYYSKIPQGGWACFVFSNHDFGRGINRFGFGFYACEKAKIQAILLLTLKGTPFYYGDEIGMLNAHIPRKRIVDKYGKWFWPIYKGRDQSRTPMQWDASENAGFSAATSWLPLHKNYSRVNVAVESEDEKSVLVAYKKIISLRKAYLSLSCGEIDFVNAGRNSVLAFMRFSGEQRILIVLNFSSFRKKFASNLLRDAAILFSTNDKRTISNTDNIVLESFEGTIFLCSAQSID